MCPGVADHITLGIPQYARGWWLRTWRAVPPGCVKFWPPARHEYQKAKIGEEVWRGEGIPTIKSPGIALLL